MPSDGQCLVVGTAKTGTTAMVYAMREAFGDPPVLFEKPISECQTLPAGAVAKVIFEHEKPEAIIRFAQRFERRVMLLRDPRDNLISRMLYAVASRPWLLKDDPRLKAFIGALRRKQQQPWNVDVGQLLAMIEDRPGEELAKLVDKNTRLAVFHRKEAERWHVVRYEAMIAGDLAALSGAIGRPVQWDPSIDPVYARVARTRGAGDWRRWFTRRDVNHIRPVLAPLLLQLGYADDWELEAAPVIQPEHSWGYVSRLIDERRRHYGIPPFIDSRPRASEAAAACNICGSASFGPGPQGRMASNGRPPACLSCGSLERQRILRAAMHALPLGLLSTRRALAFRDGAGLQPAWFRSWHLAGDFGDRIDQPPGSLDFILLDHALEYIEDDRRAFDDMLRLLSPAGLLLVCFAAPELRASSEHFTAPAGPRAIWHRYGADLARHFKCAEPGLGLMRLSLSDPCTGSAGQLHLFFKNPSDTALFQRQIEAWDPAIAVQTDV